LLWGSDYARDLHCCCGRRTDHPPSAAQVRVAALSRAALWSAWMVF
jgi:hypothetical protein